MTVTAAPCDLQIDLQLVVLLALLPKDGTRRTVAWLAQASGFPPATVNDVLFIPWYDREHGLEYDIAADSYFIQRGTE